jgi:ABC-type Fe3+-hydroxamate transport system substrate-binding protein
MQKKIHPDPTCGNSPTTLYVTDHKQMVTIMKAAKDIVSMLGGTTQTAAVLGVTPQAVSNWLRRGGVPAAYATKLIKAAGEKGVALNYSDLIE